MKTPLKPTPKIFITISLLIAMQIILSRFLSIQTPILRIGFAFLPLSVISILFGPFYSSLSGAISDILGALLFPSSGVYFPGFTLTAFLSNGITGAILYKKPRHIKYIICAVILSSLTELIINTLNLYIISGYGFLSALPTRIFSSLCMMIVKTVVIYKAGYFIASLYNKS